VSFCCSIIGGVWGTTDSLSYHDSSFVIPRLTPEIKAIVSSLSIMCQKSHVEQIRLNVKVFSECNQPSKVLLILQKTVFTGTNSVLIRNPYKLLVLVYKTAVVCVMNQG
jgi:hypothetical protein